MAHHIAQFLPGGRTADRCGAALALALAGWVALAAGGGEGRPAPMASLVGAAGLAFAAGRVLSDREALTAHRVIVIAVAGALVITLPGVLRAGGAPLGYANANASLTSLGVLAAIGVAAAAVDLQLRLAWAAVAAGLVVCVVLTGSTAGGACLCGGLALLGASAVSRRPAIVVLGGPIVVMLVLGCTVAIAKGADVGGLGQHAAPRQALWAAAADITIDHPLQGVGPGVFGLVNSVSSDPDLRWAHHGYLQLSAETGLVGLSLMLAIIAWAYARLAMAAMRAPLHATLASAALTVVALHATVDHTLHHAPVALTLAGLVGASTASPPHRDPGTLGSPRPAWGGGTRADKAHVTPEHVPELREIGATQARVSIGG